MQADATRDTRIAVRVAANGPDEDVEGVDVPRSGTADGLSAVTLSRTPSAELGLATVTEESQSWSRKDEQQLQEPEFRPYSKGAERQQAHEWAEAHGRHHTPLHAGRAHVLEEQEHAKSQGGTASETIRPHRIRRNVEKGETEERVEYAACASPLQRKGPKSPKQRRPGRRLGSAGLRVRATAAECSRAQGGGAYGTAFPPYMASYVDSDSLYPVPQLVDHMHEGMTHGAPQAEEYSEELSGGEGSRGRDHGQNVYMRRRLPLKDEFRQMIHDNKARSEALKRSAEAIESLTGALDANNAEKQLLVKVLKSCAQQGSQTPREESMARKGVGARRSQVAFICQMLAVSSDERAVLESMPDTLLDALEDVMRLNMTYAEAVARVAELDETLLEWQRWYSKRSHSDNRTASANCKEGTSHPVPKLMLARPGGRELSPRESAALKSPRSGEDCDGPVAAAHMRSQLSHMRLENERLRMHLQEIQMHVVGKSPRGRERDGSQLVLDLLQKDLATAKAHNYNLMAEVESLAEHSRRVARDSEAQKLVLHDQINALQIELDTCKRELERSRQREDTCRGAMHGHADIARAQQSDALSPPQHDAPQGQHAAAAANSAHGGCETAQEAAQGSSTEAAKIAEQHQQAGAGGGGQRGTDGVDMKWMPAVLAHLESGVGRVGEGVDGDGERGGAAFPLAWDLLPERWRLQVEEAGGLVLQGLEAPALTVRGGDGADGKHVHQSEALTGVLSELRRELAGYYRALRGSVRDAASQEPLQSSLIQELRLLQLIVASFDAQLSVLHTPKGALALAARRSVSMLADAAAAEGEPQRVIELVRELERACVAAELRRKSAAGFAQPLQQLCANLDALGSLQALPDISHDLLAEGANSAEESLVLSLNGTAFDPDFALSTEYRSALDACADAHRLKLLLAQARSRVAALEAELHGLESGGAREHTEAPCRAVVLTPEARVDVGTLEAADTRASEDEELTTGAAPVDGAQAWLHNLLPDSSAAESSNEAAVQLCAGRVWMSGQHGGARAAAAQPPAAGEEGGAAHTPGGAAQVAAPAAGQEAAAGQVLGARVASFKAKQPAVLALDVIKAHPRDTSLEDREMLAEQDAADNLSVQLSLTGDEDSLSLSTAAATPGDPSASICAPSEECARQPHDADADPEDAVPLDVAPATERVGGEPPPGVPSLPVHLVAHTRQHEGAAECAPAADADRGLTQVRQVEAERRPMSASTGNAGVRLPAGRQRPQSATTRGTGGDADLAGASFLHKTAGQVEGLGRVLEAMPLSPVADVSLGGHSVGSPGKPLREESNLSVSRSEPYISDGSAESDEDVLAHCDLERDERDEHERDEVDQRVRNPLSIQPFDAADKRLREAADGERGAAPGEGEQGGGQDLETAGAGGEETEEERERRLRAKEDNSVKMEMVQQYNQFEKVGSTLEGVAEDEQEEEEEEEEEQEQSTPRPEENGAEREQAAAGSGGNAGDGEDGRSVCEGAGVANEGTESASENVTPREMSWERREIDTTPRGEHDLRAARGDKPARPDDRRARRSGRPTNP